MVQEPTFEPAPGATPPNPLQAPPPPTASPPELGGAMAPAIVKHNEQMKKGRYNKNEIPSELAPRWEMIVHEAAKRIKHKRDTIKAVIGERPYQGIPIDPDEAKRRYVEMRDNAELQAAALQPNIVTTEDGRILINKEYIKTLIEFEQKIRKGEIIP